MGNAATLSAETTPPSGDFKKFNERELNRLKKVFDALYERFPYKTISHETLYKTFPLPESLAERLAQALDTSNSEIIDFQPMLEWLSLYCRGSMQLKMEILFRMYGVGNLIPVSRDELEALLNSLMTPISKFFSLSEHSQVPIISKKESDYVNGMLKVIFDGGEIPQDGEGKITPEDYLDWQRANFHLVDMLERLLRETRKKEKMQRPPTSASPDGEDVCEMEGVLLKIGRTLGNWHERWWRLKDQVLYGYRTEKDKNHNDFIELQNYTIQRLDDKVGFYGFKLTARDEKGSPKALYCKNDNDREAWVRALEAAGCANPDSVSPAPTPEPTNSNNSLPRSSSARRVSSPRTNPINRHIKKYIRLDADKKFQIMQDVMLRLEVANNRLNKLDSKCKLLRRHAGISSTAASLEDSQRKVQKLESQVAQLKYQLESKNKFILELKQNFQNQSERNERRSMAAIQYHTTQADDALQKQAEKMADLKDKFREQMTLAEADVTGFQLDIDSATSSKIDLIKNAAVAMDEMRNYIGELETALTQKNSGWFT